jgi:murein DD-endopeptidase MepM/ murein hydrolase activator NlpD
MKHHWRWGIIIWLLLVPLAWAPSAYARADAHMVESDLAAYIDSLPGALAQWNDGDERAASVIQMASDVYAISPRLVLATLETTAQLMSTAQVSDDTWDHPITTDPTAPSGFAAQIEWSAAMLRAGLGPYEVAPVLTFSDGVTHTINLQQSPEGIAVQRLLAVGRSAAEWRAAMARFVVVFDEYFAGEIVVPMVVTPETPTHAGFLQRPWPAGVRVRHLAYFDHTFPTVDSATRDNGYVTTYLGRQDVQYDGHDGHDYAFPDQLVGTPILAAADGMAYASTRRGNGVYILHADGYTTVYWHLDKFSRRFKGLLNQGVGVPVRAGDVLGSSGSSGFVVGTPHLHFEVRRYGKQVDPYGWYGIGPDPCLEHPLCTESQWLWDASLAGEFDFTPPDQMVMVVEPSAYVMGVAVPEAYQFVATFDHDLNAEVAHEPVQYPVLPQRTDRGIVMSNGASMRIASSDGFRVPVGAWSLWVNLDDLVDGRTYLMAASATADASVDYAGTLAVRVVRDGDVRLWEYWSVNDDGTQSDVLRAPVVGMGWQHVTVAWHLPTGGKRMLVNGTVVAQLSGVSLPTQVGDVVSVGRFPAGKSMPVQVDDVVVWNRIPTSQQIRRLVLAEAGVVLTEAVSAGESVRLQWHPVQRGSDPVLSMRIRMGEQWQAPVPFVAQTSMVVPTDCVDEVRLVSVELYTRQGEVQALTAPMYCADPMNTPVIDAGQTP